MNDFYPTGSLGMPRFEDTPLGASEPSARYRHATISESPSTRMIKDSIRKEEERIERDRRRAEDEYAQQVSDMLRHPR